MASSSLSSSSAINAQSPGVKTYFKTPEGRYKLLYEKTHPVPGFHFSHGKAVSQLTIAYLREKLTNQSSPASSASSSTGVRSAAARLWGGGNGNKLNIVGGNGVSRITSGSSRFGGSLGASTGPNGSPLLSNYDGKGAYLIFNVGDTIFISDLNSQDKDPIKAILFSNSNPICHAFDIETTEGHDLLIGLHSGDVYSVSLRQQLQDPGRKLIASQQYNKDGLINGSRCTCITWVPDREGMFVVGHADGNIYVYEKSKDSMADCAFPIIKDPTQFVVAHSKSSRSNPIARWHICQGAINGLSFSSDGTYMATVGRDGYMRVFDYAKEQLIFGGKSYYGALLCCSWSPDGKYILTGGEDDLVQVWCMEDRKVVAWGEGHNSWVSGVAFDSYWLAPSAEGTCENAMYRFGSVGQDTQLLLWDLSIDELVLPLRGPPGGSPKSIGSPAANWDSVCPVGTLLPSPSMSDVPKLSPLVAHRVHVDPLSGLIFTAESIITISREGHIKIWARPAGNGENQSSSSESVVTSATVKDKPVSSSIKSSGSSFKQPSSVVFT